MTIELDRRAALRASLAAGLTVVTAAASPAYATSITQPPKCIPAKVKSVAVKRGSGSKKKGYHYTITPKLTVGLVTEVTVWINAQPTTLHRDGKSFVTNHPIHGDRPLVYVKSCGKAVWFGIVGKDC